ncbi:MAG TPA: hypothetical protein PLL20_16235 [Phycisphaerae bacterium]|nr:hypothetical protein [Phycisphaerae bacterium]HRR86241.1 hypothetical protein [Phycisphaerae bacterium]
MNRSSSAFRWSLTLSAVLFSSTTALSAETSTAQCGRYRVLTANAHKAPPFEVVDICVAEKPQSGPCLWQIDIHAKDGADTPPLMQLRAVTSENPLSEPSKPPVFDKYILRVPAIDETIEYRNVHTGKALLPSWGDFARHFIPHAARGTGRQRGLPNTCEYLGHVLSLRSVSKKDLPAWEKVTVLNLDPELLIGTGRTFKDKEGHRLPQHPERRDYTYIPWTQEDYVAMIEAGHNYFALVPGILEWLRAQPVFYRAEASIQYPTDLYRSNMLGPAMFIDEPTCIMTGDKEVINLLHFATDATALITKRVRAEAEQVMYHYESTLRKGVNFGDMRLSQPDFASWETRYETAFYQLAGGTAGIVHEGRYQLGEFNDNLKASTGIDRPMTAEQMYRYYYAFLRGAARHFNKDWGTSIYGQADPKISPLAIEMAYDMGARYIWYWTSDHDHHMPFPEQLDLTRSLKKHMAAKPRPSIRTARPTLDKAIVVPYGYVIALESPTNRKNAWDLWWVREMDADGKNEASQRYYRLRRAVLEEVFKSLDANEEFDIIHDDGGEITGYRQLVRLKAE